MAESAGGIREIAQIAIRAKDQERAVAFYRDVLGLRHLFDIPSAAFFQCGGVRLMIGVAEAAEFDHPSSILYYRVDDIHAEHERLTKAGVQVVDEPHLLAKMESYDLWMGFYRDSEENVFALMGEVAR